MNRKDIMIIGAGPMAIEYAKVLKSLGSAPVVIGRSEKSAEIFFSETGIKVFREGINSWLSISGNTLPDNVIIAVGEKSLGSVTRQLIDFGAKKILVEKPGGLNFEDISSVNDAATKANSKVFVGYNRRFYSSVMEAKKIIKEDGGVTSFNFEFTEWSHVISPLVKEEGVKEEWFLANSTHVIDLAFYLGGHPAEISAYSGGGLVWHPQASIFAGAGRTISGALFSYQANWEAPGRWGVEILTKHRRIYLRPLEKISIQKIGSIQIDEITLGDDLDKGFKPGLYLQTKKFIDPQNFSDGLLTIHEQVKMLGLYLKIRGDRSYRNGP
jgi:predicted dehydrogenase